MVSNKFSGLTTLKMHSALNQRLTYTSPLDSEDLKHRILNLDLDDDLKLFNELKSFQNIQIVDQIESQIRDLIKLENPKRTLSQQEYEVELSNRLKSKEKEKIGVWVFYPWRKSLVHLLSEDDFVRVRTIRNQYKITASEQKVLSNSIVGIIGLSVGQSVSLALALERIAGEIRVADYDVLELSNMNRIRSSVANIGLKKSTIVYREIAELDPFIKVKIFDQGISKDNIDQFLLEGGKLNLLVEECDGVEIKVLARQRCKLYNIPVIMDMSDRGMFDIERYDLDGDYPLLHGLVNEDLSYDFLASLKTSEEKLPYMLPMVGFETLSPKMKASILEVATSISTWPQLGSDVLMGGAVSSNVTRRILLGESILSGRTWIDIDDFFQRESTESSVAHHSTEASKLDIESSNLSSKILSESQIIELMNAVRLAPSPGNVQRWRWRFSNDCFYLFNTHFDKIKLGDNGNVGSNLSYGAALENLILKAGSLGFEANVRMFPESNSPLIATVEIGPLKDKVADYSLSKFIGERQTLRIDADLPVDEQKLEALKSLVSRFNKDGFCVQLIEESSCIENLAALIGKGDRLRLMNSLGYNEFFKEEVRWSPLEAIEKGDGLDLSLFDFTNSDLVGLRLANDDKAMEFLRSINGGQGFEKISPKSFKSNNRILVFYVKEYSPSSHVEIGRLIQRFWLHCAEFGIGFHPYTVLQMLFSHLYLGSQVLNDKELNELNRIHDEFHSVVNLDSKEYKSVFLSKLILSPKEQRKSCRKPLNHIFK